MTVRVRFAPSPTGKLHVGNIRAALINWLYARKTGGEFLLRSDDTDSARSTKAFEEGIQTDLAWLGLTHDDFARQSERFSVYDDVAEFMKAKGMLYPCYETPEELDRKRKLQRARSLPPVYDRAALSLTETEKSDFDKEGRTPHWRFKLSQTEVSWPDLIRGETKVDTITVSDPVLIRADGHYLYTLPSCIDDIDFGITHVIRGEDHVTNTATQVEIFKAIIDYRGSGKMPAFAHHSLLVGKDGEGLSKRFGSLSIEGMREDGLEPSSITSLLARLGTSDPVEPIADLASLADGFDFARMGRAPARFDAKDLVTLNAKILHNTPFTDLSERLVGLGISEDIWLAIRGNIEKINDCIGWKAIIDGPIQSLIDPDDKPVMEAALVALENVDPSADGWRELTKAVKTATGRKGRGLFMPLRKAITGLDHGPEMGPMFALIGKEKIALRLKREVV